MKKAMNTYPKELVEIIRETYPGYWPLTQEQICYFLFRKVEAERSGFWDMMGRSFPYDTYLHKLLDRGLGGPPFPKEIPEPGCLDESDRTSENHLELWVDDTALTEFLRFHSWKFTGIPVYDAGRLQNIFAAREVKDRLRRLQETTSRLPVVLFLADLDAAGHQRYEALTDLYGDCVHFDRVGINVKHVSALLCKPRILCDDKELTEDEFFATELSLPGCYSLSALEPPALVDMVCHAVNMHRMWASHRGFTAELK